MLLKVEGLEVAYHKVPALRGLGFAVAEREIVSFVGPNGAGKSTTAMSVAGIVRSTAGSVIFDGVDITRTPAEKIAQAGISLVPEGRRIFGRMTVRDNLLVGTRMRRASHDVRTGLDYVFSLFPILAERQDSAAGLLSGGEQQQLAIARALMTKPRLMIVDEPSLGLAPRFVDLVFETFAALRNQGLTLLIMEQSSRRALALADRVYLVRSGGVVKSGTVSELSSDPSFEAAYFGEVGAR